MDSRSGNAARRRTKRADTNKTCRPTSEGSIIENLPTYASTAAIAAETAEATEATKYVEPTRGILNYTNIPYT